MISRCSGRLNEPVTRVVIEIMTRRDAEHGLRAGVRLKIMCALTTKGYF